MKYLMKYPIIINRKYVDANKSMLDVLERVMVSRTITAIAIIFTIKTWARANDIKEDSEFGNKYLVGTLSSITIALIASYVWLHIINY